MNTHKLTVLFLAVFAIASHAQTAATIPYTCDFEDATERGNWTLENGTQTNKWFISTAAQNGGSYGLYISNDNGTTNAYTNNSTSYVYAYRSISFTTAGNYTISFNWRSNGESNYDVLRAFLVPDNVTTLTGGNANSNTSGTNSVPSGWIAVSGVLNGQGSTWQSFSASVNVPSTGTYKLAFFWKNDNIGGTNPPAAVDNISVSPYSISATALTNFGYLTTPYTQPAAQTVTITNNGMNAVTLTQPTSTNFTISTLSTTSLAVGATATFTVRPKTGLAVGTYSETITISGNNNTSATVNANFVVMAADATLPYTCNFEDSEERGNWTLENGTQTNKWAIGTAAKNAGSYGLYISNDNGTTNAYTITTSSYVYAYRSINFTSAGNHTVSFNWKSNGYSNYDNFRAFLVPGNVTLTAGNANGNSGSTNNVPSGWIAASDVLSGQGSAWQNSSYNATIPNAGTYKLVFFWKNYASISSGTNPPAAVDNISVSKTYSINASTLTHFGYLATPYTQPATQTVTITNDGLAMVTITQPTSTNFDIGTLSATSLAVGETASFTVQPKSGLSVGTYSETITISGNDGIAATISANFRVMQAGWTQPTYYITGVSGSFSASKISANGTPINANATNKTISNVIDAIRIDANGAAATIQFGDGVSPLNISTEYITFSGSTSLSPRWGAEAITLEGKITSTNTNLTSSNGTIYINYGASITSKADITNTGSNSRAVVNSSGVVNISGGTVQATGSSYAVYNSDNGVMNISGGKVTAISNHVIMNSSGVVNISGGMVQTTSSIYAVFNSSGVVNISGGTVQATSSGYAVYNSSTGVVNISGGTVENTANFASSRTIYNNSTGTVNISGGTVSATAIGSSIYNYSTGTVIITGGTISNTGDNRYFNANTGGTIIEWSNPSVKTYTSGTSANINILPATATAVWLNKNGSAGIDWVNGIRNGFIALSGITVGKADPTVIWPVAVAIIYGAALSTSALTGGNGAGTFTWATGTSIPTVTNSGYSVTFTPTDTDNYNTLTQNIAITVNKANPAVTFPTSATITYGQTLADAVFAGQSGAGTFAYANGATSPTVAQSGTAYQVTFTPTDAVNYNTRTQSVAITVNKASGLGIQTAVSNQMISSEDLTPNTFDLTTIIPDKSDHGTLSYTLGAFTDGSNILSAAPTLSGTTLTYTGTGKPSGTATQVINIASGNYTDISVTITFEATSKQEVVIGGITAQNSVVYNGGEQKGYTGTPAGTIKNTSTPYTGSLVISYTGTGYGPTPTPPTNAGEYALDISVPSDNASYTGELRHEFIIEKATALTPAGLTAIAGQTLASITLTGGWAWADATTVVVAGTQKYLANYTPTDAVNYNALTNVEVSVAASATPSSSSGGETPATPSSSSVGEIPATPSSSSVDVTPSSSSSEDDTPIFTNRENPRIGKIGVQTTANAILLENLPANAKVEVYNLQGKRIYSTTSHSPLATSLNIKVQTGVYLLKIGSQTTKVAVK
ncbi:hypothetical protein R83H12_00032 [Fibrobacteria bacterium R8-3-H12]